MNIDITSNIDEIAKLLKDKADKVPDALHKAVVRTTAAALHESRNQLSEQVYNQPIPTRKNGKPAWKRTSNLIRQERAYYDGPLEGVIDNAAPYAQPRHDLNRPSPVDGKVRKAEWRKTARENIEPKVQQIVEDALRELTD